MFLISNSVTATILIEEFEVSTITFSKLLLIDTVGGALPVMELTLNQTDYQMASILRKLPIIELTVGSSITDQFSSKYKVKDVVYNADTVTITALLHIPEHMASGTQSAIKATSTAAIKAVTTIESEILVESVDEQVWIKDGTKSDWDYILETVMRAYVSDNDPLLHAYTVDGKLVVDSLLNILSGDRTVTLSDDPKGGSDLIRFKELKIEFNNAIWDSVLINRHLPVFKVLDREMKTYRYSPEPTKALPQLIDCGNCHENYYQSYINYLSITASLNTSSFWIDVDEYINREKLDLLGKVKLELNDSAYTNVADPLSGVYIVGTRSIMFSAQGCSTRYNIINSGAEQ